MNLIIVSIVIALFLTYIFKVKRRRDIGRKIQGPRYVPLIGYVPLYFVSFEETLPLLCRLQSQFERFFKVWIGPEFWFVVYDPKLTEHILTDQKLKKSNDYKFLKPWIGNGLLTNEGKSWFAKRKTITPAFHFTILESFIEIFNNHSEILMKKFVTDEIINVTPHLLLSAFNIICETSMGTQTNTEEQFTSEYIKAVRDVAEICYKRMFNPLLQSDFIFWCLKDYKIFYNSLDTIDKVTQAVINERREYFQKDRVETENFENPIESFDTNKKRKALLDILLTATVDGKPLSDAEIKDEVNTFLFAGHDTTASTLSFLLYNIAKYKDVQEKIYDEIEKELFENGVIKKLTINKLNNLTYLDLVIKESMRFHVTVPFIGRQTEGEYQLDNVLLPDNTNLTLYMYGMCHDHNLFPEPEKFIPERFATNYTTKEFNPFSYIPFSAGHRNCIGQKFALLEMKTIVVKILEKFEISLAYPNKELILIAGMILKAKDDISKPDRSKISKKIY
ncbi:probable cytochrome P450 4d14 [Condylostylus longicornis]|uniref:probable cytochrome P450 4d14 n=1 Tax=Condylostylus longicornis TaxID=2530218 RepID=UPI00244DBD96|nr:probable cytochrome P450 4d14 [Condylostylus longicornis]